MDPNRIPPNLNLQRNQNNGGGEGYTNDRSYPASNERVYPTTPSTFPQPVFQQSHGNQDYVNSHVQSPTGQGYFAANTQYSQYNQQGQYNNQSYQQTGASQPYSSPRTMQANDPNSGLAHQFSTQNLGPQSRQGAFNRPARSGQNFRSPTGGQGYGSHLGPNSAGQVNQTASVDETPPEQDPNKFSPNIGKRVIGLHLYVENFFKDNIKRARERNIR
jgi:protein-serine/threonine kinase